MLESVALGIAVSLSLAAVAAGVSVLERLKARFAPRVDVHAPIATVRIRVVAARRALTTVLVDAVVFDTASSWGPTGWPVSFEVRRASNSLVDDGVSRLLGRWADDQTVITVTRRDTGESDQVALADGESTLCLDLV